MLVRATRTEPALSTETLCRWMVAAKRSGGATGEPSRRTDGVRVSRLAPIMYDWPVIQPVVATTKRTSAARVHARRSKTSALVTHRPVR